MGPPGPPGPPGGGGYGGRGGGGGGGRGGGGGGSHGFWEGAPGDDDRRGMGRLRRGAGGGSGGRSGSGDDERTGWRRYIPNWKVVTGVFGLAFLGLLTLIGVAYAQTPVPSVGNSDATKTAAIFYYSDGKTEIGRIGKNRELVTLDKVPKHVQEAVIAAENRSFWTDSGFSPKGLSRAIWVNLTGGETQGGSTITQQLAKNYYLTNERTMSRKFKEMFISLKLEDQLGSKEKILEQYLNTVYFGRNAYGIQAASKAFYRKDVSKLNPGEGALLAAIIQQPGRFDPASDDPDLVRQTKARYQYVLDGMRKTGQISQADYQKYYGEMPQTATNSIETYGGQRGYMIKRAILELQRDQGITEKQLLDQGLRVTTTFNKTKMAYAKQAVESVLPTKPSKLLKQSIRTGLASVNTTNGEVEAIYGGPNYLKQSFDNVWRGSAQAGSAMKPYVLATALEKGYSLKSTVEGRSGVQFNGAGDVVPRGTPGALDPIRNSHNSPGAVDLVTATRESTNTAFVQLALKLGVPEVVKSAEKAGISPDMVEPYKRQAGLALGINDIRPIEQAAGYAVFANGGTYYQPHVVKKVRPRDSDADYKKLTWKKTESVFSTNVTRDVTYALQQVVGPGGTAPSAKLADRPVAGKTGTTEKNVATWFVGYVPKISTSVTLFNDKKKTLSLDGQSEIVGGGLTAKIWNAYMTRATRGTPPEQFAPPAFGGRIEQWAKPPKQEEDEEKDERDDGRPPYCNNPRFQNLPQCQDPNRPGDDGQNGDLPPCVNYPIVSNCDPNKPPQDDPRDDSLWCQHHPNEQVCKNDDDDDDGGNNDPRPPFPQTQSLSRRE
ncbi:transglycosylase domain-containing protein [Actinomadura sp. NBRC 104412]|uniref:transglycosylase domain-containing protein n=1 Tax=Actinomadura sp. NBRC 104412 TaxID=3032203 RepID=UPI0025563CC1|nr:transglycosylase domain-containing protein [Actinomadura sp. NBRC 104412]